MNLQVPAHSSLTLRAAEAIRRHLGYKFPPLGSVAYQCFFKLLPREIDIELLPSIRAHLNTDDGTQRATYWQGTRFEKPTPEVLKTWASRPEAIFFDIGSNYGWFSFYLASELPDLRVHAFEPNPATFNLLQEIASRNQLSRLRPWHLGLGDHETTSHLRIGIEDSGHSTFGPHPTLSEKDAVEISIKSFDAWRQEAGLELPSAPCWVAKIDVEGFEYRVINGMQEALTARAFYGLAVEVNRDTLEFCGSNSKELIALLERFGYVEYTPGFSGAHRQMNKFFVPRT